MNLAVGEAHARAVIHNSHVASATVEAFHKFSGVATATHILNYLATVGFTHG